MNIRGTGFGEITAVRVRLGTPKKKLAINDTFQVPNAHTSFLFNISAIIVASGPYSIKTSIAVNLVQAPWHLEIVPAVKDVVSLVKFYLY